MKGPKMQLVSVVRVSTKGQDTEGQIPANQRWAEANGHTIVKTIPIKDSAYKAGSQLDRKLDEILAAKPEGIVMRRADRLSRRGIERGLATIRRIRTAGVRLFFADLGDAAEANELLLSALFYVAHEESRVKAERTLDNHGVIANRGAWMGVARFGYSVADPGQLNARLIVNDAEVKILTGLFEQCRDGASLNELEEWAASLGYVRPTPKGEKTERPWKPKGAQLRKLLDCEAYVTGQTELTSTPKDGDGDPIESKRITWTHSHPPIIDRELFDAAQAAKGSRRNRQDYARDDTLEGLEGALRCSKCGGKLYLARQVKKGRTYVRYQDRAGHGMRRDKAERYVADMMTGHLMVTGVDIAPAAPRQETELESLRRELARCNAATDEGFARIVELRRQIAEIGTPAEPEPGTVAWVDVSMYETADWPKRRELVRKAGIKI